MKLRLFLTTAVLTTVVFYSNAQTLSKRQLKKMNKAASSIFKGQCPLERIDWMKVSDGYDKNAVIALATEIQASAKADADQLKKIADGNASGKVEANFDKTISKMSSREVNVSKEFYEQYLMMRTPICNIYQSVQSGFYNNNPQALMDAQKKFIEMNDNWLKFVQEEQKKSQH